MRLLFTTNALLGHFHPLVPLAEAARRRGHEVRFAGAALLGPAVERAGFRLEAAGPPADAGVGGRFPELLALPPAERANFAWRHNFADQRAAAMVPDLLAIGRAWRPALFVREDAELGACVAAEVLGLPHAAVQATAFRPRLAAVVAEPLARLRAAHGLPPDPAGAMLYRHLYLVTVPPALLPPEVSAALPATACAIRPVPFDRSGDEALPPWMAELPARPSVYLTLGTIFGGRADVFAPFVRGLADAPVNLIVTVGRNGDPASLGPLPPNTRVERYVPQTLLLPRCAAVVFHGGSGTMISALQHGLPLVVVPLAADQPENAARSAAAGAARVVLPADLTPDVARAAVLEVLGDPAYRRNAERVRDEIAALPSPDDAVRLLEGLVERHAMRPVPPAAVGAAPAPT